MVLGLGPAADLPPTVPSVAHKRGPWRQLRSPPAALLSHLPSSPAPPPRVDLPDPGMILAVAFRMPWSEQGELASNGRWGPAQDPQALGRWLLRVGQRACVSVVPSFPTEAEIWRESTLFHGFSAPIRHVQSVNISLWDLGSPQSLMVAEGGSHSFIHSFPRANFTVPGVRHHPLGKQ